MNTGTGNNSSDYKSSYSKLPDYKSGKAGQPGHYKFIIQSQIAVNCSSFVRFAALLSIFIFKSLYISFAILFSIAAPIKKVLGLDFIEPKPSLILIKADLAVFQCSSAPAGSIPPLSSPKAMN